MQVHLLGVCEGGVLEVAELAFGGGGLLFSLFRSRLLFLKPLLMLGACNPGGLILPAVDVRKALLEQVKLGLPQARLWEHLLHFGCAHQLIDL